MDDQNFNLQDPSNQDDQANQDSDNSTDASARVYSDVDYIPSSDAEAIEELEEFEEAVASGDNLADLGVGDSVEELENQEMDDEE